MSADAYFKLWKENIENISAGLCQLSWKANKKKKVNNKQNIEFFLYSCFPMGEQFITNYKLNIEIKNIGINRNVGILKINNSENINH